MPVAVPNRLRSKVRALKKRVGADEASHGIGIARHTLNGIVDGDEVQRATLAKVRAYFNGAKR